MEIGSKGLMEANLIIPQGTSLTFTITHKDLNKQVIDHTQSSFHMAFQTKTKKTHIDLSSCCTGNESGVTVTIPASITSNMDIGKMFWDIIVETKDGEFLRLVYGNVSIIDTYALDGV